MLIRFSEMQHLKNHEYKIVVKNVTYNFSFVDHHQLSYLISFLGCCWNKIHHNSQHGKISVQEEQHTGSV